MKKTNQCPKCTSTEVVLLTGDSVFTKIYRTEPSEVRRYACTDCGYVEDYLDSTKEITEIKKKFGR